MPSSWILVLLFVTDGSVLVEATPTRTEPCQLKLCSVCSPTAAICETSSVDESFLQSLHADITYLSLRFKKPQQDVTKNVTKSKFRRFTRLEALELSGDFAAIEVGAFDRLTELKNLTISNTRIESIPDQLFKNCLKMEKLELRDNLLVSFPFSAFKSIKYGFDLRIVNLRSRPITLACENGDGYVSLPAKYNKLYENITSLSLVGLEIQTSNCAYPDQLSDDFFLPFNRSLHTLDVSTSNFFTNKNNSKLLNRLDNLVDLRAGSIPPYKTCPADAKDFFTSLPKNLKFADFRRWETLMPINPSCVFTEEVLQPLSSLKKLESLSFQFTDFAFGLELNASVLPHMESLKVLDLGYCGISRIYNFPDFSMPSLDELRLHGNPLGSRRYLVSGWSNNLVSKTVTKLSLSRTGIWSNQLVDFDLAPVLEGFPNLTFLDLSDNLLRRPPIYNRSSSFTHSSYVSKLQNLVLDGNIMQGTGTLSDSHPHSLCSQFPNLTTITLANNNIRRLNGMCNQVQQLDLSRNALSNDTVTLGTISGLRELQILDLTDNNIGSTKELLSQLVELRKIYLSHNHIYELAGVFFQNNLLLEVIDLSSNYITTLTANLFKQLKLLESLRLSENLISTFPEDFLDYVNNTESIKYVYFDNCPIDCRCTRLYFQEWVRETEKITDASLRNLRCTTPSVHKDLHVLGYTNDPVECVYKIPLIVVGSILAAAFVSILIGIPCYKYSWYIMHIKVVSRAILADLRALKQEHVCEYDAYVSYNREDQKECQWVVECLIPAIEKNYPEQRALKLYVEGRDAPAGSPQFTERTRALKKSNKILVVVSNSYLKSASCLGEADLAGYEMYGTDFYLPNRILVLVREELTEEIIKPPMTALLVGNVIQVSYTQPKKLQAMRRNIRAFVSASRYVYRKRHLEKKQSPDADSNDIEMVIE